MLYGVDISKLKDCKLAPGKVGTNGYYRKSYKNKVYTAHRLAYILAYGEPQKGYEIHHLCHDRQCIEPTHLVALTGTEHRLLHIKLYGVSGAAKVHQEATHCSKGHLFNRKYKKQRTCSICQWERNKAYRSNPVVRNKINARRRELRTIKSLTGEL